MAFDWDLPLVERIFVGFGSLLRFCFFVTIPVSLFDTMVQEGAFLFFYCLTVAFGVESFCLFLSIVSIFDFILYVLLLLPDHLYTQYSTKCYYVRILNRSEGKIVPLYRSRLGPPPSQAPLPHFLPTLPPCCECRLCFKTVALTRTRSSTSITLS